LVRLMIGSVDDFLRWLNEPEDAAEPYLPVVDINQWKRMEEADGDMVERMQAIMETDSD
jgi:hypothetical protein